MTRITEGPKKGRTACCVPFCGRTFKCDSDDAEFLCGKHYRLSNKRTRQLRAKVKRQFRSGKIKEDRYLWLDYHFWKKIKKQAIERAAGL